MTYVRTVWRTVLACVVGPELLYVRAISILHTRPKNFFLGSSKIGRLSYPPGLSNTMVTFCRMITDTGVKAAALLGYITEILGKTESSVQ